MKELQLTEKLRDFLEEAKDITNGAYFQIRVMSNCTECQEPKHFLVSTFSETVEGYLEDLTSIKEKHRITEIDQCMKIIYHPEEDCHIASITSTYHTDSVGGKCFNCEVEELKSFYRASNNIEAYEDEDDDMPF